LAPPTASKPSARGENASVEARPPGVVFAPKYVSQLVARPRVEKGDLTRSVHSKVRGNDELRPAESHTIIPHIRTIVFVDAAPMLDLLEQLQLGRA